MAHPARSSGLAGLSLAILLGSFVGLSLARAGGDGDDRPPGPPPGPPRRPPPAAFDACKNKQADAACEVTFRDRKITGTCVPGQEGDGELFCRPDRPPGPPPELFTACEGKSEGDDCTVRFQDGERQGHCGKGRSGRLLCLPQ